MSFIVAEDQFSVILNTETGEKHLKYEDDTRSNWTRTVCGVSTSDSSVLKAAPKIRPRDVDCKKCLAAVVSNIKEVAFVSPKEYDYWTNYGKKSRKYLGDWLKRAYKAETDKEGTVHETVKFLNGSSIEIYAHTSSMGDCGDPHVDLTINSLSYGQTQSQTIEFSAHSFNRVADAIIYLLTKVKMNKSLYSTGDFHNPHEELYGILEHMD